MKNLLSPDNMPPLLNNLITKGRDIVKNQKSLLNLESDLKYFLKSQELLIFINALTNEILLKPNLDSIFLQEEQILLCNDFSGLVVAIGYTKSAVENSPLYSSPAEVLLGAISLDGFEYQFQEIHGDWDCNVFSSDIQLSQAQAHYCSTGNTVLVPTSKIFDYRSNGNLIIKIAAPATSALTWEFNRNTGNAESVHASTLEATILSYIIKFLAVHGNDSSIHAIKHMIKHRFHYIRWDAVKTIGKIDPENLSTILKEMKKDPHIHIKFASEKMLSQLGV